jgi:hypothetical protein
LSTKTTRLSTPEGQARLAAFRQGLKSVDGLRSLLGAPLCGKLYSVGGGQRILARHRHFFLRRIAHIISDAIYEKP